MILLNLHAVPGLFLIALGTMCVGAFADDVASTQLAAVLVFGVFPFAAGRISARMGLKDRVFWMPIWWIGMLGLSATCLELLNISLAYGWIPGVIGIAILNPMYKRQEDERGWSRARSHYHTMSIAGGGNEFWKSATEALFCPKHSEMTDEMVAQNRQALQYMRNHLVGSADQVVKASEELDDLENLMLIHLRYASAADNFELSDKDADDKAKMDQAMSAQLQKVKVLTQSQRESSVHAR